MSLEQRGYSILVASAVESFNSALADLLPESSYSPVRTVTDISAARRTLAERSFDFVIVNSPLPDDPGVRFAIDACTARGTVVLLLVKSDAYIGIYDKVVVHGVFTLSKPVSKQSILMALSWMASARERLRRIEKDPVHRGENGGNPPREQGKMAADQRTKDGGAPGPPLYREAGYGPMRLPKKGSGGNHPHLRLAHCTVLISSNDFPGFPSAALASIDVAAATPH